MRVECWVENKENILLDLIHKIRHDVTAGNQFGAPDELLFHSGGPEHDLARKSMLLGPANRRYIVRQKPTRKPSSALSPLKGELDVQLAPSSMEIEVEEWNGFWKYSHTIRGANLSEALRKISSELPPLVSESGIQAGGLAGLLNYDMVQYTEPILLTHKPREESVLMILYRADRWIIYNRDESKIEILSSIDDDPWAEYMQGILAEGIPERPEVGKPTTRVPISESDEHHAEKVRIAQSAIRQGALYQLNYGRIWQEEIDDPWDVFERLNRDNPSPLSAWLYSPDLKISIASSSPELLLSQDNQTITTRPIKGTRPRGDDAEHDANLRGELVGSEKEIAEHLMLVDLERNDLGRICKTGSVYWKRWRIEAYPHVQHMVSEVQGTLRHDKDGFDALQSLFPGGSITGCPKSATIAAIDELEQTPRSSWTGSIGHIDPRTKISQWNILIRTMESHFDGDSWQATVQAGGGLVIGSNPMQEVEEAKWKAQAICQAAWDYSPAGITPQTPQGSTSVSLHPIPPITNTIRQLIAGRETGLIRVVEPEYPEPIIWNDNVELMKPEIKRVLFVDNLDSFSWNIIHTLASNSVEVIVVPGRSDLYDASSLLAEIRPTHLVLGPGPGRPEQSDITMQFANLAVNGKTPPTLGICLGHQALGLAAGWELTPSKLGAVHGVPDSVIGATSHLIMTRYHSLSLTPTNDHLKVTEWDANTQSIVMALAHNEHRIFGVQYHPESAGSVGGEAIFDKFLCQ